MGRIAKIAVALALLAGIGAAGFAAFAWANRYVPPQERRSLAPLDVQAVEISPMRGAPYGMRREILFSPIGLPCNKPPWGMLAAVDIETGTMAWQATLGNTKELAPFGMAFPFGTPNFGGPLATAGGLVFIGATMDNLLHGSTPAPVRSSGPANSPMVARLRR